MSLTALLGEISHEGLRAHVTHIADNIPSRLAGSPGGHAMAEYSAKALTDAGASARIVEMHALVSFPEAAQLDVATAAGEIHVEAQTCGHSATTDSDGVRGMLVDVGGGSTRDYAQVDVAGKIALADLALAPARIEKQRLAAAHGARGLVTINWGTEQGTELPYGSVKPAWGTPTRATFRTEMAAIPSIGVSRSSGLSLQRLAREHAPEARLHARAENSWLPLHYTLGEIAGQTDDFMIVGGHQDSWFGMQATDNATGSACLIELARLFNAHRHALRRGVVFGLWTGHETGTMASSAHFVDHNWDRLREHAVAYLQIDQPGCVGATRWSSASNLELKSMQQAIDAAHLGRRPRGWRRSIKIGDASFFGLGVPMLSGIAAFTESELKANGNAMFGWWHHTDKNTLDKVDWDDLAFHLRIYASYVWTVCTAPVLPFDFVLLVEAVLQRLREIADRDGVIGLDKTIARGEALRQHALRLEAAVKTFNATAAAQGSFDDAKARRLDRTIKRLSRLLLPIESTASDPYGHDPYGFTPQSTVLPGLYDMPLLADPALDTAQRRMLETELVRARNRITDALDDSCALIDAAIEA